ncbi:hypothetical protein [Caulobacter sp. X]|uniref:hypothetical protein n=1 Tax=Caulobacter sp. X TaxID=2048901 RepID=UPI000C14A197|nr:hypothetical protein [Caulobacter sp. X]PIB96147.1 hypothetical protein CSW60_16535 [Caulobacter sp. X]
MMSLERFEDLAEIYGGDIARWPEGEREAARALLAEKAERLAPVLAAAAQLDRLLDLAPAQSPDAALIGRLISAAPRPAAAGWRWFAGLSAALGLSVAAAAGVVTGVMVERSPLDVAPRVAVAAPEPVVTAVDTSASLQDAIAEPAADL